MDERRDLVDREELRRRLERERDCCNPDGSHAFTLRWVIEILDAMPAVECPRGWTRDEVLAELDADPDAYLERQDRYSGRWSVLSRHTIPQWHPEVRRYDVRVAPEPEWVPLTQLVGRTIHGETEPVTSPPAWTAINGKAEWRWLSIPHGKWLPFPEGTLNLETGQVAVRPKGEA